jgi:hypothetical protein
MAATNLKNYTFIYSIENKVSFFYSHIFEQELAKIRNGDSSENLIILDKKNGVVTTNDEAFVFSYGKYSYINHAESGLENFLFNFDSAVIIPNSGVMGMFIRFENDTITLRLLGARNLILREAQGKPIGMNLLHIIDEGLDLLFSKFKKPLTNIGIYKSFKLDNVSVEVFHCCINKKDTIIDIYFRKNPTFLIS